MRAAKSEGYENGVYDLVCRSNVTVLDSASRMVAWKMHPLKLTERKIGMQVWPAIDLLGGKCVRLQQGDYNRDTVFGEDPGAFASHWFAAGAEFLHCVDLDGAKSGSIANESAIRQIVSAAEGRPVQLGGGVRDEPTIVRLLELGLSRLVVGTSALRDPEWFAAMCEKFPGHIVLGLDARDGMVATQGWLRTSSMSATELICQIQQLTDDVVAVVFTDISRDGMLAGPNWETLIDMHATCRFPVIASGGLSNMADIEQLCAVESEGVEGVICGRAIYSGDLDFAAAQARADELNG